MRIGRIIGGAALLAYMATLVLAGLPPELRPSFLDRAHRSATRLLGAAGIRAGQLVFHATDPSPWQVRAYCLYVRGTDAEGDTHMLWPRGECVRSGFRWRLPPVERTLYRLHREASRLRYAYNKAKPTPIDLARSDYALRRVGEYMCRPTHVDVPELERVDVVWLAYKVHYETEEIVRLGYVAYRMGCREGHLHDVTWEPSAEQMVAFWENTPPWL